MPSKFHPGKSKHLTSSIMCEVVIPASGNTVKLPHWMTAHMYCSWKPLFVKAWDKLKLPRTASNKLTMTVAFLLQKRQLVAATMVVKLMQTKRFRSNDRGTARQKLDKYFDGKCKFPFTADELRQLASEGEKLAAEKLFDF